MCARLDRRFARPLSCGHSGAAALSRCCKLLRTAPQQLAAALCQRRIDAAGESITVPVSAAQAAQARDAVAKALYSRLFNHLVRCINRSLGGPGPAVSSSPRARKAEAFAEEEEATAAAQEAVEAEVEAEAVAEAEAATGSAGSDYWSDAPLDVPPSPAPRAPSRRLADGATGLDTTQALRPSPSPRPSSASKAPRPAPQAGPPAPPLLRSLAWP
eukprot:5571839-Prymnesium_polylepis.1